jgi:hypothetical protein
MAEAKLSTTIEQSTAQGVIGAESVYIANLTFYGGPQLPAQPPRDAGEHAAIPPCPYPGLAYFGPQDSGLFFGRERAIARLQEAVNRQSLTALVGASGSGKSSVVLAGLAPRLNAQGSWLFTHFRVGNELDKNPFLALARALVPLFSDGPGQMPPFAEIEALAGNLEKGRESGGVTLRNVLGACRTRNPSKRILLMADQFEEVFTLVEDDAFRRRFIDVLLSGYPPHADRNLPQICLVLTLRADFYGAALRHRPLADALQGHVENLGPMSRNELREAIVKPAGIVTFESGLVETLLDEVTSRPGSLPLLQFALREMWGLQRDQCVTRKTYDAIGGVQGALARRAQTIFDTQTRTGTDVHAVKLFQRLFLRMVTLGEGAQDTRRVVGRRELGEEAWALAQRLANEDNRLLVTNAPVPTPAWQTGEVIREETTEVMHEALIRNWPTLMGWISGDRSFLSWLRQLKPRVDEWRSNPGDEDTLLRGTALAIAEDWLAGRRDDFSDEEKVYIEAGIALREASKQKEEEVRQAEIMRQQQLVEAAQLLAEEQRLRAETADKLAAEQIRAIETEKQSLARTARLQRRFIWFGISFGAALAISVAFAYVGYRSALWANYRIVDRTNRDAARAPDGNMRRSLLLLLANLDATAQPNDVYGKITGGAQSHRGETLQLLREMLPRMPWFAGRYQGAGLDPAGGRIALLGKDSLLVLTLPVDEAQQKDPKLQVYRLPDRSRGSVMVHPAAGFLSGLGPAAFVDGYIYYWSQIGEIRQCDISSDLPSNISSEKRARAEFISGGLQVVTVDQDDQLANQRIARFEASQLSACLDHIPPPDLLKIPERDASQPLPVFSNPANPPQLFAYLVQSSEPAPNELAANLPVDPQVSRPEYRKLVELDAILGSTGRDSEPTRFAVGQAEAERGIPERMHYTIALADNAHAAAFKFDGPDLYVYNIESGHPTNRPGYVDVSPQHIAVEPPNQTNAWQTPVDAWRLAATGTPWSYPPLAVARVSQHWRAAWLAPSGGVWAVDASDLDPGTARPILGAPLIGEPGGVELKFGRNGEFLVLQWQHPTKSDVYVRVWDLQPSWLMWIESPKTTEEELRRVACRVVRADGLGGAFDETEMELFQIDSANKEPCPETKDTADPLPISLSFSR